MPIKVGDRLPEAKFRVMGREGPAWKTTDEVFKGKKVVLFAVPGAFTPTCSNNHLPGFLNNADAIKAKGVDTIAVTASTTYSSWTHGKGDRRRRQDRISRRRQRRLRQGHRHDDGRLRRRPRHRSKRYAMLVDNGVVKTLNVEEAPGKAETSSAENLLKSL